MQLLREILAFFGAGKVIYDPFSGSGSALMACESEGRTCYAMELDPIYCDVIVNRWQQATGKTAERLTISEV